MQINYIFHVCCLYSLYHILFTYFVCVQCVNCIFCAANHHHHLLSFRFNTYIKFSFFHFVNIKIFKKNQQHAQKLCSTNVLILCKRCRCLKKLMPTKLNRSRRSSEKYVHKLFRFLLIYYEFYTIFYGKKLCRTSKPQFHTHPIRRLMNTLKIKSNKNYYQTLQICVYISINELQNDKKNKH